jgi:hypothetical protein
VKKCEKNQKKMGKNQNKIGVVADGDFRVHGIFPYMEGMAVLNVKMAIK